MHVVHLLASPFVGGPERQVLGLARALNEETTFLSFAERGLARPFLEQARGDGFEAIELKSNFPRVDRAIREVAGLLRSLKADILCTNGYKPDLVGWRAARRAKIPVVGIAHGWTGVTWKVRCYEWFDRLILRWFDAVVCVSEGQRPRVLRAGISPSQIHVIRNALDASRFDNPDPGCYARVREFFAQPPRLIIGAAGRLSVEKGFDVLLDAADIVRKKRDDVGFLILGEGPMRASLEQQIARLGLVGTVVLGGFRTDLERLIPGWDVGVLSSHTEGLPVAVLEAQAAGVPVVATAVGGTPEVIEEGVTGYLVPPANPEMLAERLLQVLGDDEKRRTMGQQAHQRVRSEFTFQAQAAKYRELFSRLKTQTN